jgi:hypothetical protein
MRRCASVSTACGPLGSVDVSTRNRTASRVDDREILGDKPAERDTDHVGAAAGGVEHGSGVGGHEFDRVGPRWNSGAAGARVGGTAVDPRTAIRSRLNSGSAAARCNRGHDAVAFDQRPPRCRGQTQ